VVAKRERDVDSEIQVVQEGVEEDSGGTGEEPGGSLATTGVIGIDFTIAEYLAQRNIRFSSGEGGVKIQCPSCKKRARSLSVNSDLGSFKCTNCGRTGGFANLRKLLGDNPIVSVSSSTAMQFALYIPPFRACRYTAEHSSMLADDFDLSNFLAELGITEAIITRLKIGADYSGGLLFPFMYTRKRSSVSYITKRADDGSWCKVAGDAKLCSWFGQHLFKTGNDEAFICQTPLDAAALMSLGEKNVLAPPQDHEAPKLRTHQLAVLERCSVVYLVPNPTHEGQRWVARLQGEVGQWRTKVVQMDYRPAELIKEEQEATWRTAKEKAVSSIGARVRVAREMMGDLDYAFENRDALAGFPTKLEPLDKLLGGWRPGEVTIVSGEPGVGKSTFCAFISLLQASDGNPALHFSFEVSPFSIMKKWMTMLASEPFGDMDRGTYIRTRKKLARRALHIPQTYGICEMPEVRRSIYDSCTRNNIRFVVLDHLGFLSILGQDASNDIKTTGSIMREVKRWSLDLGIHIILVHHLRKRSADGRGKHTAHLHDLRGSGEVSQLADNVMLLSRTSGSPEVKLALLKVRDDAGFEGVVKLQFSVKSLRYMP